MQLPSATIFVSAVTTSASVEASALIPIYSNVLSHTVLANPAPSPVLPRAESPLSSYSSTITLMELALIPGPEKLAPALPISPSSIYLLEAPATLNPVYGRFSYHLISCFLTFFFTEAAIAIASLTLASISILPAPPPVEHSITAKSGTASDSTILLSFFSQTEA